MQNFLNLINNLVRDQYHKVYTKFVEETNIYLKEMIDCLTDNIMKVRGNVLTVMNRHIESARENVSDLMETVKKYNKNEVQEYVRQIIEMHGKNKYADLYNTLNELLQDQTQLETNKAYEMFNKFKQMKNRLDGDSFMPNIKFDTEYLLEENKKYFENIINDNITATYPKLSFLTNLDKKTNTDSDVKSYVQKNLLDKVANKMYNDSIVKDPAQKLPPTSNQNPARSMGSMKKSNANSGPQQNHKFGKSAVDFKSDEKKDPQADLLSTNTLKDDKFTNSAWNNIYDNSLEQKEADKSFTKNKSKDLDNKQNTKVAKENISPTKDKEKSLDFNKAAIKIIIYDASNVQVNQINVPTKEFVILDKLKIKKSRYLEKDGS